MHLKLVLVAKNILAKLCCSRVSHLKPLPSGAGQKGSNSLAMACLKRVESFLIIENKKKERGKQSSYGNVYKFECDNVILHHFSSISCDTGK